MLNVALTGNVAAGKSTVARLLRRWGATLIDSDAIVRELQRPGMPVLDAMVDHFGPEILAADGSLDRTALRRRVMEDDQARAELNAIVHPAVWARRDVLLAEAQARGDSIVLSDIPLLFETHKDDAFDAIILVDAPRATRRRRLIEDRGLTETGADQLMDAQLPSAAKRTRSTYVIDNDGSLLWLARQTRQVWDALMARASSEPA